MKLSASGFHRDHGPWGLGDTDLYDKPNQHQISMGEVGVYVTEGGEAEVIWSRSGLTLNGDYIFILSLSRRDVARLFVEAFGSMDVRTVLTLLNGAGERAGRRAE